VTESPSFIKGRDHFESSQPDAMHHGKTVLCTRNAVEPVGPVAMATNSALQNVAPCICYQFTDVACLMLLGHENGASTPV
jgi:hypothetical protein